MLRMTGWGSNSVIRGCLLSALPESGRRPAHCDVRKSAITGCEHMQHHVCPDSLDHLVGELLEMQRHVDPECARGFEVDHQVELGRFLDGEIGGLRTLQDSMHVTGGAAEQVDVATSACCSCAVAGLN